MSSNSSNSILDETITTVQTLDTVSTMEEATAKLIPIQLLDDEIDPRLKLLSHSSRTTLHTCPRKYQLYRLSSQEVPLEETAAMHQDVTFAYGSAVGVGVQSVLEGKTLDQAILDTFLEWDADLLDGNKKQNKSYWLAQFAVQKFAKMRDTGFLNEYELVYFTDKEGDLRPAVELAFQVTLPNGFKYRGFVDAVLRHKETGAILVLENKTSSGTANASTFKNSGQALGYSVVLDILFPMLSSYTVLYLVYESKTYTYVELPFTKSLLQRALWLQELLIDTQLIELYESYGVYPMHGESCFDFFRDCEYLGVCTLDTKNITKPLNQLILDRQEKDLEKYEFSIDFHDLVEAQIAKGSAPLTPASPDVGDGDNIL